jgi:hypothetical protein
MKFSEAFPSKYAKPVDAPDPVVTTVKAAVEEDIKGLDGVTQRKVVVYFAKKLKPLPLNRTNFETLCDLCGSDNSEDFPGTKVEVFKTRVQGPRGMTDGLRFRAPGGMEKAKPKKAAPKDDDDKPPFNDEISY